MIVVCMEVKIVKTVRDMRGQARTSPEAGGVSALAVSPVLREQVQAFVSVSASARQRTGFGVGSGSSARRTGDSPPDNRAQSKGFVGDGGGKVARRTGGCANRSATRQGQAKRGGAKGHQIFHVSFSSFLF